MRHYRIGPVAHYAQRGGGTFNPGKIVGGVRGGEVARHPHSTVATLAVGGLVLQGPLISRHGASGHSF